MKKQEHNEEAENLRQLRHDLNNHLSVLYGLCDMNQYEEVKAYIIKLIGKLQSESDGSILQGHKVLSVLINNKKASAMKKGIRFRYDIRSEKLPLTDPEICSLFGNILDNAMEANRFLPPQNRWMDLFVRETEGGWIILCKNPCRKRPVVREGKLVTGKRDPVHHGIGTEAMRSVVARYGGILNYHIQAKQFQVFVFFPAERR